jgi:hypothetical protein
MALLDGLPAPDELFAQKYQPRDQRDHRVFAAPCMESRLTGS